MPRTKFIFHITLFAAAVAVTAGEAATDAAGMVPYAARIAVASAQIRSGPGENFYPTDTLPEGEAVEVYRERSDGWLAIRPPRDSFSWVFGRHLKIKDNGLAEIDKPDVDSRIGSRYSGKRNAVQVRLHKGEVVEILGEETSGTEKWCKIAPPAGEFRWIHASQVQRRGPLAAPSSIDDATEPVVVTSATADAPSDSKEPDSLPASDSDTKSAGAEPPVLLKTAEKPLAASSSSDPLTRQLADIDLRLSRTVAESPEHWDLEPLRQEATHLLDKAQGGTERDAVRATIGKIDRFAAIEHHYHEGSAFGIQGSGGAITPIAASSMTAAVDGQQVIADGQKFDAIGILRPVVSRRPGAPQFALVDERGQVVSFVTPTPDTNLQPYVGRRVGVVGQRGYIAEFKAAHIVAGRVAPVNQPIIR